MATELKWLTLEDAAQAISVEAKILEAYLTDPSPEKRFHPHGLLFDPDRQNSGQPFLQLLELNSSEDRRDRTLTSQSDRAYRWENTPIRLEIFWLPMQVANETRMVMISATSYDEFPVSNLIDEAELGELPAVLNRLLEELRNELPVRKLRYQKNALSKNKSSSPTHSIPSKSSQSSPAAETTPNQADNLTQISLF